MTRIQRYMDTIINSLKASPGFEDVRFVREFGNQYIDNPISGFLAAVCVKSFGLACNYLGGLNPGKTKGNLGFAEAEIMVCAPKNKTGSGLSLIAANLAARLKHIEIDGEISGISADPIEFDQNLCAVIRRVKFRLEFFAGDECDE